MAKGLSYFIPPELREFGKNAYELAKTIRPFQGEDLPVYDPNKSFGKNMLDMATGIGTLALDFGTLGLGSAPQKVALKVAEEAAKSGTKTGVKTVDDIIEEGVGSREKKIIETKFKNKQELFNSIVDNPESVKILEDARTGKITLADASQQLSKLTNKKGFSEFSKDKNRVRHSTKFTELLNFYTKGRKTKKDYQEDIFDIDIISNPKSSKTKKSSFASPEKKKLALEILESVKNDASSDPFGVKFRNAYKKIMLGENASIPDNYFKSSGFLTTETTAKNILNYQGIKITPIKNPNTVQRSPDGTKMIIQKSERLDVSPQDAFGKIKVGDKIEGEAALKRLKQETILNDESLNFRQVKDSILRDKEVSSKMQILEGFFKDKVGGGKNIYSFDHIQSPKFGGGNTKENLIFIMEGPHSNLKNLPVSKTSVDDIVKPKSRFENQVYKKGLGLVDAVKKGNLDRAKELSEEINKLQSNFKETFTSVDFVVGQPYVSIKTGDKTAKTITYAEDLKLTPDQIEQVNKLLPTYSNRPNAGLSVEESIDRLITMYGGLVSAKGSKLTLKEANQLSSMKEGGMVGISHLTRPL